MSEINKDLEICKLQAQLQEKILDLSKTTFAMNTFYNQLKLEKRETKFFILFSIVTWGVIIPLLIHCLGK